MTCAEIYNTVKRLYNNQPSAQEWFSLSVLMRELWLKYGHNTAQHLICPDKNCDFAQDFIKDACKAIEGYPLQYIVGKTAFWNGEFFVGEGVLIPRSDTERIVELALERCKNGGVVYDLCCGSGCIGISMLKSRSDIQKCYSFDISQTALEYTQKNAEYNGVFERLEAVEYDIMSDFEKNFPQNLPLPDIIVSNPPYIRSEQMALLPKNVGYEPEIALYGGDDGCDFYRKILKDFSRLLLKDRYLIFEISPEQAEILNPIFHDMGFDSDVFKDYRNNIRAICGKK